MITEVKGSNDRVTPYNEVLGIYMELIAKALESKDFSKDIVMAKTGSEKDVNRAPLVIVKRGAVQDSPSSIGLSEEVISQGGSTMSITGHILNYAIIFESFGNSYAEAENIGNIILETVLSSGQSGISELHPSISGARLTSWSESIQTEASETKYTNSVTVGVFLIVGGQFNLN